MDCQSVIDGQRGEKVQSRKEAIGSVEIVCHIFFFQAEDGIRDVAVTGVQTCALPICYPLGVAWAIEASGKKLKGANFLIRGDIPLGAGLSSSAAIEVATGFALLEQRSEERRVGKECRSRWSPYH